MARHITLLFIFVNLLIGIGAVFHLHYLYKIHRHAFLKHLALYTAILNLGIFQFLIHHYVRLNIAVSATSPENPLIEELLLFSAALLTSLMVFCQFSLYRDFMETSRPRCLPWFPGWMALVLLFQLGKNFLPNSFFKDICRFVTDEVIDSIILAEIFILITLLIRSRKVEKPEKKHMVRGYGYLYLSRFFALAILLLLSIIPRPTGFIIVLVAFFYINLVPFLWTRFFFRRFADETGNVLSREEILETAREQYALSKREAEILKLILEGLTNREIDARLFLSYHTVKNHVTSIYRKLNVRNRYQLIRLLTRPGENDR